MTNKVLELSTIPPASIAPTRVSRMGLIIGLAKRNPQAAGQLYDDCAPSCYGWLLKKQLPEKEATELLVKIFVYAIKNFDKYNPNISVLLWMFFLTQKFYREHYPNKKLII
jgi:hypothetical protein